MTYALRAEIFSKEVLTIEDIQKLYAMGYDEAAKFIRDIRKKMKFRGDELRVDIQGKLHVQDYLDYLNITDQSRYRGEDDRANESI